MNLIPDLHETYSMLDNPRRVTGRKRTVKPDEIFHHMEQG
jgi:hypothetical protein